MDLTLLSFLPHIGLCVVIHKITTSLSLVTFTFCTYDLTGVIKLNFRNQPSVFLGFPHSYRGCRCLDLVIYGIIVPKTIDFDQSSFPFSSDQYSLTTLKY